MEVHSIIFSENFEKKLKYLNTYQINKLFETIRTGYNDYNTDLNNKIGIYNLSSEEKGLYKENLILYNRINSPKFVKIINPDIKKIYLGVLRHFHGKRTLDLIDVIITKPEPTSHSILD